MENHGMFSFLAAERAWLQHGHHICLMGDCSPKAAAQHLMALHQSDLRLGPPDYDPEDAAAAFVAIHKNKLTDVRLKKTRVPFGDLFYSYAVWAKQTDGELMVRVSQCNLWALRSKELILWSGPVLKMEAWAETFLPE